MATAYTLGVHLSQQTAPYGLAIQAGVGGALTHELRIGQIVQVTTEVLADLGAEDRDGTHLTLHEMGLPPGPPFDAEGRLRPPLFNSGLKLARVAGLTVNRTSGCAESITRLKRKWAGPRVESMEGAAFFYACMREEVPVLQLRAISNYVEPRDRSRWEMGKAIEGLNDVLRQVLNYLG